MASTYTTNLGIEKPGTGEQSGTWGTTANTNYDLIDQAINGIVQVTLAAAGSSGSPNTIDITNGTASDGRNKYIEFVDGGDLGATAYVQLDPNDAEKIVHMRNSLSGSRSVIVFQGTYNASNDFEIPAGKDVVLKFDGGGASATVTQVFVDLKLDALDAATVAATTGNITTVNSTTVDTTNLEVTNLKAKDGTSAGSIANSTGVVTIASAVLTTADINGGTMDGVTIGGASTAAGSFTTVTASGRVTFGELKGTGATVVSNILDEDNMSSNSDTALATQQSIKAYVDSQVGTVDTLAEILANGNTSGANNLIITAGQSLTTDSILETSAGNGVSIDSVVLKDGDVNGTIGQTTAKAANFTTMGTSGNATVGGTLGVTGLGTFSNGLAVTSGSFKADVNYPDGSQNVALGLRALDSLDAVSPGQSNTAIGHDALTNNTTGDYNTAVGRDALDAATTSDWNTAVGAFALSTTPGGNNTAVGGYAGEVINGGIRNTLMGYAAGRAITTANYNTGLGYAALLGNTALTGDYNVGVGFQAGLNLTSGSGNILIGRDAGKELNDDGSNVIIGNQAGDSLNNGDANVAIGAAALGSAASGNYNVAIGYRAMLATTAASAGNVAVGYDAGYNTTGTDNVMIGNDAMNTATSGNYNVALGAQALFDHTSPGTLVAVGYRAAFKFTADESVALGAYALGGAAASATTGRHTAVGFKALQDLTSGVYNTAVGGESAENITTGSYNNTLGTHALRLLTSGANNIAIGYQAGYDCNSNDNVFIGHTAGTNVSAGAGNVIIGEEAGATASTASVNTFVGQRAGYSVTGGSNTMLGRAAGQNATSGTGSVIIGNDAGENMSSASRNIYVGVGAGQNATGSDNIAIGYGAGASGGTGAYNVYIGGYTGSSTKLTTTNFSRNIVLSTGDDEIAAWYYGDMNGGSDPWQFKGGLGYNWDGLTTGSPDPDNYNSGSYGMFHQGSDNDTNVRLRIAIRVDSTGTYEYPANVYLTVGSCDSSGTTLNGAWYLYSVVVNHDGTGGNVISTALKDSGGDTGDFSVSVSDGGSLASGNAVQLDMQVTRTGAAEIFYNAWYGGRTWAANMWRVSS